MSLRVQVFGRRPPQRVEGVIMPASKNLHISGLATHLPFVRFLGKRQTIRPMALIEEAEISETVRIDDRARLCRLCCLLGALSDIRKSNSHVVARYGDRYFSEPCPRVSGMNTGPNIELVPVPGANDMHLGLGERHAFAGTILGDDFLDLGHHLALARGSAHVRALIEIGKEFTVKLEYGHLEALEGDDPATRICKFGRRTDMHLAH
jgi:hypothetical protein